ncbi:DUF5071 domain-containing protein [Gallaecimonas xiamenensis]|uniref:DUF5071 domain-containing protein n=1 Tax=Gallaecimonas xiamenensis 3-C-1 TaxID=745411 RepID=K2KKB1_9GAMM|nr:DUF5071 domain-containing protein [Gallaecimonas xiamenensis]EKE77820.1 hypothetical protein B3C1_00130 [Gallaecimonas xiamenensis 3-C-1]
MQIVPRHKGDDQACNNLRAAPDEEVILHLDALLECLQDINWPIAGPVSERLACLGVELVEPVFRILKGDDEVWKYWIVSHFLYQVKFEVLARLRFLLHSMRAHPSRAEVEEEVHDVVCALLQNRRHG